MRSDGLDFIDSFLLLNLARLSGIFLSGRPTVFPDGSILYPFATEGIQLCVIAILHC
jgi:hypothetical protein